MNQQNIQQPSSRLPVVNRPDVGTAQARIWKVTSPELQRSEAEAVFEKRNKTPRPQGLISRTFYLGTDGVTIMEYSQWENPLENLRDLEDPGGFEAPELYTLYRSDVQKSESSKTPGCIVAVEIEFMEAEPEQARQWVDDMFDSGFDSDGGKEIAIPGLISAHFHISLDGKHVLNYAEWTDEESHRRMMEGGNREEQKAAEENLEQDEASSAIKEFTVTRFQLYKSLQIN